jgi:hypothetical protein
MGRWVRYQCVATALTLLVAVSACTGTPNQTAEPAPPHPPTSVTAPSPSPSPSPPPTFTARDATTADVPRSWRAGCPVGPDQLSVLTLSHWGFDNEPHVGTLIAHRSVAAGLVTVFQTLYNERFPIRLLEPVDRYDGSDDASMAADNTSAFNCRKAVAEGTPSWSEHAFGRAIDVNPVENPYVFGARVLPPAGRAHLDRTAYRPGYAVAGGVLVAAFAQAGWKWGGARRSNPDYQHFSTSGN